MPSFRPARPTRPADFPATPRRLVIAVALAVLLVHVAVVELVPLRSSPPQPQPQPQAVSFVTEAIEVTPPPPPPPPPAAAPTPKPVPQPSPRVAAAAPPPHKPRPVAPRPTSPTPPAPPTPAAPAAPAETPVTAVAPAPSPDAPASPTPADAAQPGGHASATAGVSGDAGEAADAAARNAAPAPGKSAPVHAPVRLSFALSGLRGGVQPWSGAFGDLTWRQTGNGYSAELALKVFFRTIRRQTSSGHIGPAGIAPDRFADARKAETVALFQRDSGQVVFSSGAPPAPLRPGAQDRLSVVMQLGALLAGDPARYTPGTEIAVQTVGPRDAETWVFRVGAEETVEVPAGRFVARRLTRQARHAGDYALALWLAPDQGYLPVQMRQTEPDGDIFDLQLRDISQP